MIDAIGNTNFVSGTSFSKVSVGNNIATNPSGGFDEVMKNVASTAVDTITKAETTAIAGISDKASIQQVVDQVMAAERTLQTAIAVRDKVVSAYQEISRMAI